MIQPLTASASLVTPTPGRAGLRAELARYEKERAACVNCATAETRQGQQEIQRLSDRIAQIQARLAENAPPAGSAPALTPASASAPSRLPEGSAIDGPLGTRIDIRV